MRGDDRVPFERFEQRKPIPIWSGPWSVIRSQQGWNVELGFRQERSRIQLPVTAARARPETDLGQSAKSTDAERGLSLALSYALPGIRAGSSKASLESALSRRGIRNSRPPIRSPPAFASRDRHRRHSSVCGASALSVTAARSVGDAFTTTGTRGDRRAAAAGAGHRRRFFTAFTPDSVQKRDVREPNNLLNI